MFGGFKALLAAYIIFVIRTINALKQTQMHKIIALSIVIIVLKYMPFKVFIF